MANKTNLPDGVPEAAQPERAEMLPIEEHCARLGIGKPVLAGVLAANGWKPGRVMDEAGVCRAVREFTGAPMGAKAVK